MAPKSSAPKAKKSELKQFDTLLEANLAALEAALESGSAFKVVSGKSGAKDSAWPAGESNGAVLTGMLRGFVRAGMKTIAVFATRAGDRRASGNRSFTTALKNGGGAGHFFQLTYKGQLPDTQRKSKDGTLKPSSGGPDIEVAVI